MREKFKSQLILGEIGLGRVKEFSYYEVNVSMLLTN